MRACEGVNLHLAIVVEKTHHVITGYGATAIGKYIIALLAVVVEHIYLFSIDFPGIRVRCLTGLTCVSSSNALGLQPSESEAEKTANK